MQLLACATFRRHNKGFDQHLLVYILNPKVFVRDLLYKKIRHFYTSQYMKLVF